MKFIYSLHDHHDRYDNNNKDLDPALLFSDEECKFLFQINRIKTFAQITVPFSNYFKISTSSFDE